MTKTPKINSATEKHSIISFITTGHFPILCTKEEKKCKQTKSNKLSYENGVLYTHEESVKKIYVRRFESKEIQQILLAHHLLGHLGINNLRERVTRNYSSIILKTIKVLF
ncbi:hypothetical protein CDIK_2439 [Cucumispora dikerogammari]|nr:hypothetical protein CDIK_2439 [Cucumispora dikerogammari]